MGDFNLSVILDAIRRSKDGLSRVELAAAVGLAPQTVSNICRRLLDQDLIIEAGKEGSGPGKPRTMLRLNPPGMYAVGVHLDPAATSYALLDLVGSLIRRDQHATDTSGRPELSIAEMGRRIGDLVRDAGIEESRVAGVGVATPGPIDSRQGTVVDPPHLPGWHGVPLRDALAEASGLPVLLDKDVTAAAVAEMWAGGASGTGSFVFFYIGTGLGCGLVLNDEVMRGTTGNAGEIGHIVADPDGQPCDCGRRGCIRVSCMPEALVAEARELGVLPAVGGDADPLHNRLADLSRAASAGDEAARGILDRSAIRVACAVSVVTNLLDVQRVVFGGPFWPALAEHYLSRLPALVQQGSVTSGVHSIEVVGTGVGEGIGAIGAACLVLESRLGPHAAKLLLAD
jgi:predicted NBD/HSP70 family sugar kinase